MARKASSYPGRSCFPPQSLLLSCVPAMITTSNPTPTATGNPSSFNATYVWMISAVAAMGGLLFGYDWVVIGGAAKFYEAFFPLKDTALLVAQDAGFWEKVKGNAI